LDFNKTILEIMNCRTEDLVNKSFNKIPLFHDPSIWEKEILRVLSTGDTRSFETDINRYDGTSFPVEVYLSLFSLADIDHTLAIAVCRNIADRKKVQETLFQEKEKAQVTLHSIGDAVITTDADGIVDYLNPIAEELTGWSFGFACGKHITEIFHIVDETNGEPVDDPVTKCIEKGLITAVENHTKLINKKGAEFSIENSAAPILNREGHLIGAVLVFHDVSSSRELANQLSWQASHDPLTGLLNRRELEYRIDHAIESAKNQKQTHTLLFMDLDQFKIVNDTSGHLAGDELLKQISSMLMCHMRESDSFARLGGDEFGVLLQRCSVDHAIRVANEIKEAISAFRFVWDDKTFEVGVSIGLVPITDHTPDLSELIGSADAACYAAKDHGRNRIHVFTDEDTEVARRRGEVQWVTRIQESLENDLFEIFYQKISPTQDLHGNDNIAELLIRMKGDDGTVILPGAFLPSAERYNLMEKLDRWMLEKSFQYLTVNGFPSDIQMFNLNLSALSISSSEFLQFVRDCFAKYPVPYEKICFEITETSAISNLYTVSNFIYDFRSRGSKIALDDFGSGLSSFGYLKNLTIDYLKIDGTFVKDIVEDPVDETLVEYINQLGHVLGLQTIAEYVESEGIYDKLKKIGVDYIQGFWLDKPSSLKDR
ncbi:MAG: EAL domain-containing protein, partial [Spirochaetia bacterium]|nr:EAL domain-containing protein [Spirochaetia bacterium]